MTYYIILALCIIIVLSYIFDITSKYSRIPGVIFLIILGIGLKLLSNSIGFVVPNLRPVLPVVGTLGLIMIVMEAALDIEIKRNKKKLIVNSVLSAFILTIIFVVLFSLVNVKFFGFPLRTSILNALPISIISSSVAIPAAVSLSKGNKEFIVYESAFSDILGIMAFNFVLLNQDSVGAGIIRFFTDGIITIVIALFSTAALAILLHKTTYHVNYVIILTAIILFYSIAGIFNLPALLLILVFGFVLSNNRLFENDTVRRYVDFVKFGNDINSFKKISGELTFLVKSFFFIIFGFYARIEGLFDVNNLLSALVITSGIFLLRYIFFRIVLKSPAVPLVFFAPRGLITILLFLSIPFELRLPGMSEEVITIMIFFSIFILMAGNMLNSRRNISPEKGSPEQGNDQADKSGSLETDSLEI
jgi:Kef-type K+ transport system membrane component KefB